MVFRAKRLPSTHQPSSSTVSYTHLCEVHGVNCDELLEKLNTHLAAKKA